MTSIVALRRAGAIETTATAPEVNQYRYLGRTSAGTGTTTGLSMLPKFNALDYGVDPTGVADSRAALQAAIDAAIAAGGGRVVMPPGTLKIVNTSLGLQALLIDGDNIVLEGAGMFATKLVFRVAGDLDPTTDWEDSGGGVVHRGNGLAIGLPGSQGVTRRNITLRDFQYDGGAGHTGNYTFPAAFIGGDGWDITHKGLDLSTNDPCEDITLERVWFHRWRGEVLYRGGGADGKRIHTRFCRLGDTNANAWNFTGEDVSCVDSGLYLAKNGVEALYAGNGGLVLARNFIEDCDVSIAVAGVLADGDEHGIISNNQIRRSVTHGIYLQAGNTVISDNLLTDFGETAIICLESAQGAQGHRSGITIVGNQIQTLTQTPTNGAIVLLGSVTQPLKDVLVEGNTVAVKDELVADCDYAFVHFVTASDRNIVFKDNLAANTEFFTKLNGTWPGGLVEMPLFIGNIDHSRSLGAQAQPTIVTSGSDAQPLGGPVCRYTQSAAFDEPVITDSHYPDGYRVTLLGPTANAPTYIPRSSTSFRCPTDRYLYAGCELDLEFDSTLGVFVEKEWRDGRALADTTQTTGTTLDALGRTSVILSYGAAETITAHQGIPEGVPILIRSTNGNATLTEGAAFALVEGVNLTLVADRPYMFVRDGAVLREVSAPAGGSVLTGDATEANLTSALLTFSGTRLQNYRPNERNLAVDGAVGTNDRGMRIVCTAALTLTVPAVGTLGNGSWVEVQADGGAVTIDGPGALNVVVADGELAAIIEANGKQRVVKAPTTVIS